MPLQIFSHPTQTLNLLLAFLTITPTITEKTHDHSSFGEDPFSSIGRDCTIHNIAPLVNVKELSFLIKIAPTPSVTCKRNSVLGVEKTASFFKTSPSNSSVPSLSQQIIKKNDSFDQIWKFLQGSAPRPKPPVNLIPPPDATISVFDGEEPIRPSFSFSVAPMMNLFDALHQFSRHHSENEPVLLKVKQTTFGHCFVIDKIDNYQQNLQFYWEILVMDREHKLITQGQCIPEAEDLLVMPGTHIYLVYSRRP